MEMNSAFNCAECLLYQLRLVGHCLGYNSLFCSPVSESRAAIVVSVAQVYASETMKSCSILAGLCFSLQRYVEATKTENAALNKFAGARVRRLLLLILALGSLDASALFFGMRYDEGFSLYDLSTGFYSSTFLYTGGEKEDGKYRPYVYYAHYVLNDFVILALNVGVDVCLVRVIKAELRQKMRARLQNAAAAASSKEKRKKKLVERKANALVIVNVLIYLLCRLPELVGLIVLFFSRRLFGVDCDLRIICFLAANFLEYLYMLSYLSNIFLYYKFNTAFHTGLKVFLGLERKRLSVK